MAQGSQSFTEKKALSIFLIAAAILVGLILLRGCAAKDREDLSSSEGRIAFLAEQGWAVDAESETYKRVMIPQKLEGALEDYNELQRQQGFDLEKHLGQRCDQYTYLVTNYPDTDQTVMAVLYVQGKRLIAGDVHSTALGGFMQPVILEPHKNL